MKKIVFWGESYMNMENIYILPNGIEIAPISAYNNREYQFSFGDGVQFDERQLVQNDVDSFYDGVDNVLCSASDGAMYSVLFHWKGEGYVPVVWEKCTKK